MNRIRKGDQVVVIAGKSKGRRAKSCAWPATSVVVSNVNMVKRHTKPNPQAGQPGGIVEREALDPYFQRDAVQPGHGQGRARWCQGPRGWTQIARVPLQRRGGRRLRNDAMTRLEKIYKKKWCRS
jgi:large subunit ribosomal protein L24